MSGTQEQTDLPLRVRVMITVEIDTEAWALNYGVEGRNEIRDDVIAYCGSLVRDQLREVGVLA